MSEDTKVTHPPVTHPGPTPIVIGMPAPAKAPADNRAARRTRAKLKMPPPQVILAAALAVAALELLIWQVGGVWWGVVIHAVIAGALLLAAVVWVALRWHGRRRAARSGSTPAGRSGTPGKGRNPLSRLLPGGGKSGRGPTGGKTTPGGGGKAGKPGLLDRLRPGRGAQKPGGSSTAGKPGRGASSGSPTGRSRNPLSKLFPGGGSSGKPGNGRGSTPDGKGKKSNPLSNLLAGIRDGVEKDRQKQRHPDEQTKPEPKPKPAAPDDKPTQPPVDEQLVKDAVKKAAKVKPTTAATVNTGGAHVGDMNKVIAAAEELAAALKEYEPEDMHTFVREMPGLADVLNSVSGGFRHVASRAESEWPVSPAVVEALNSIAEDVRSGAGTAEAARGSVKHHHETDIERGDAPRKGSHRIEGMWDVNRGNQ